MTATFAHNACFDWVIMGQIARKHISFINSYGLNWTSLFESIQLNSRYLAKSLGIFAINIVISCSCEAFLKWIGLEVLAKSNVWWYNDSECGPCKNQAYSQDFSEEGQESFAREDSIPVEWWPFCHIAHFFTV